MTTAITNSKDVAKALREDFIKSLLALGGYWWEGGAWKQNEKRMDRGALADLRSGLGKEPGEMARVHRHVVPYLPEQSYDDRWYYVLATLFGSFPKHRSRYSLGKTFKPLKAKSDSMEVRFVALLNAHPDDLDERLRHVVSLLKSHEQPLDWFQLLDDLLQWDHAEGQVQLRWARDFYAGGGQSTPSSDQAGDDTTDDNQENEDDE